MSMMLQAIITIREQARTPRGGEGGEDEYEKQLL